MFTFSCPQVSGLQESSLGLRALSTQDSPPSPDWAPSTPHNLSTIHNTSVLLSSPIPLPTPGSLHSGAVCLVTWGYT